jgi:DNA mismatch endonuclease, patch repair protein
MDNLTPEHRRKNMQNIRSSGTKPERQIFEALKKRRIYFATHVETLPGKPDIVFRRKKLVVFIDSDFWHGHPERYPPPKSNQEYWTAKVARNRARDAQVNALLLQKGWKVLRFWEYDVKRSLPECLDQILEAIGRQVSQPGTSVPEPP